MHWNRSNLSSPRPPHIYLAPLARVPCALSRGGGGGGGSLTHLAVPSGRTTTAYCFNVLVIRRIAKCAPAGAAGVAPSPPALAPLRPAAISELRPPAAERRQLAAFPSPRRACQEGKPIKCFLRTRDTGVYICAYVYIYTGASILLRTNARSLRGLNAL